jgi:Sulfotransferase domain/N-terminal domain of galactosyltransferase
VTDKLQHPPTIVFCITCKGRIEHIKKTLPANLANNADCKNVKFLLLDYSSPDDLLDYLKANHMQSIESGRLIVYSFKESVPFHMTHAKNMAHRLGILEGADILVNLDADNFAKPGFTEFIQQKFQEPNIFLWAGVLRGKGRKFRGCGGRIVVSSHAFLNSGGYDEKFDTWSPDDKDFTARLQRMGYEAREIEMRYLESIPHGDGMRFKEYPHVRSNATEDELDEIDTTTIVNYGKLGEGTVFRNFGNTSTVLSEIPTRIFGIGMHKTGTNSLDTALKMLGFDSTHWDSPKRARKVWEEMASYGRSKTIESHYAWCDFPITTLYKQLDKAYPGSKFILTTRNEDKWLESVKKHWSYLHNKFRATWDYDSFTHRIHKEVYGQTKFNATVFLARFRCHNAEVKEYFKNRPDDLLIMDIDKKIGWPQLCKFLRKPVPTEAYPKKFITVTFWTSVLKFGQRLIDWIRKIYATIVTYIGQSIGGSGGLAR